MEKTVASFSNWLCMALVCCCVQSLLAPCLSPTGCQVYGSWRTEGLGGHSWRWFSFHKWLNVFDSLTSSHDVHHCGQVLLRVLFAGDLQALIAVQRHQLQQRRQAVHTAQQHHHMGSGGQDTAQEEAPHWAQTLQQTFGQDQELAGVAGQLEEVVSMAGRGGDVIATDPAPWDKTAEDWVQVCGPLLRLTSIDNEQLFGFKRKIKKKRFIFTIEKSSRFIR